MNYLLKQTKHQLATLGSDFFEKQQELFTKISTANSKTELKKLITDAQECSLLLVGDNIRHQKHISEALKYLYRQENGMDEDTEEGNLHIDAC